MTRDELISHLDAEIARLEAARALLTGAVQTTHRAPGRARKKKRKFSPEAIARIAAAQRKRWRLQKAAAAAQRRG
jgi:hypothetical protein